MYLKDYITSDGERLLRSTSPDDEDVEGGAVLRPSPCRGRAPSRPWLTPDRFTREGGNMHFHEGRAVIPVPKWELF